ncbi:MAG: PPOX class F420-dependent oxidoreductase [Acidimicrobiales bacterium]
MSERANAPDGWWREFVGATPAKTAKLALVAKSGAPIVAPVWIALDGDDIVFNTGASTAKGRAIARDPRVAMCFDDERPPFSFVLVHGTAAVSEDLDEVQRWATIIGGRYMGAERAEEYGGRNSVPGELLVRVTPTKIIAAQDIAD